MEARQSAIIKAAIHLFRRQGFAKTSVAAICSAAGVATGSFYRYYRSKTEIFVAIYNLENERVKKEILDRIKWTDPPKEIANGLISEIFQATADSRILGEWLQHSSLSETIGKQNEASWQNNYIYATLREIIDAWMQKGLIKAEFTKTRILALFNVVIVVDLHRWELQITDYEQTIRDLVNAILDSVLK
ncbi:MAG: TetR/AcrR family transcriptional regulator [Sporolactobacillus sp.]|jgi:AcrR family transcriptional regulator|nr:TetR/AcrR family transcriptional regulator [Sporolactobacillus sp.]MCI1881263.1 TetR/AcrR family transcriptional regulator [Sporolactobacillus sp.]